MKQKLSKLMTGILLLAPGFALAHHGDEASLGQQLLHASFDPLHLGVWLVAAAGLWCLYRIVRRSRDQQ